MDLLKSSYSKSKSKNDMYLIPNTGQVVRWDGGTPRVQTLYSNGGSVSIGLGTEEKKPEVLKVASIKLDGEACSSSSDFIVLTVTYQDGSTDHLQMAQGALANRTFGHEFRPLKLDRPTATEVRERNKGLTPQEVQWTQEYEIAARSGLRGTVLTEAKLDEMASQLAKPAYSTYASDYMMSSKLQSWVPGRLYN